MPFVLRAIPCPSLPDPCLSFTKWLTKINLKLATSSSNGSSTMHCGWQEGPSWSQLYEYLFSSFWPSSCRSVTGHSMDTSDLDLWLKKLKPLFLNFNFCKNSFCSFKKIYTEIFFLWPSISKNVAYCALWNPQIPVDLAVSVSGACAQSEY